MAFQGFRKNVAEAESFEAFHTRPVGYVVRHFTGKILIVFQRLMLLPGSGIVVVVFHVFRI